MLKHQKLVLTKITSVKHLFKKETIKSAGWLKPGKMSELYLWTMKNYRETHRDEITEAFKLT